MSAVKVPFEIPASWRWVRVGDVFSMQAGKYISAAKLRPQSNNFEYPCYGGNGVRGFLQHFSHEGEHAIVGRQGALCGNLNLASGKFYATEHAVVVDTYCGINAHFAYWFLMAMNLNQYATATAQPGLSVKVVLDSLFPLPPLAEQKRIVAKIEKLMPLVEEYGKMEEARLQLDADLPSALEKSILQEAIQGKLVPQDPNDEPASELLKRIAAERKALVKAGKLKHDKSESVIYRGSDRLAYETRNGETVCIQDEIPFEIPDSWEWVRLSSLCDFYLGKTPPRGIMEYWDPQEVPWVSIADMIHRGHISTTKECVSNYAMKTGNAGRLSPPETLLMSFKLTIGKVSILDCAASHNEAIISIVPFHDDNFTTRDFLFTFLPILTQYAKSLSAIMGTTLNKKTLGALLIPLPSLAEQKRIVAKIEELRAIIKSLTT